MKKPKKLFKKSHWGIGVVLNLDGFEVSAYFPHFQAVDRFILDVISSFQDGSGH